MGRRGSVGVDHGDRWIPRSSNFTIISQDKVRRESVGQERKQPTSYMFVPSLTQQDKQD